MIITDWVIGDRFRPTQFMYGKLFMGNLMNQLAMTSHGYVPQPMKIARYRDTGQQQKLG